MKNIGFILIMLTLFSCGSFVQLEEQTSPLSGIYYILEGWDEFMDGNFKRADELFSTTLLGEDTLYYSYAYVGMGWTAIYYANTLPGVDNKTVRETQRDSATGYFESAAHNIIDTVFTDNDTTYIVNLESTEDTLVYANLLAGRTFNYGYKTLEYSREYYGSGQDDDIWSKVLNYSQLVIDESDSLLVFIPDYDFIYDEEINIDDIYWLRAQTFVRLGDLESAKVALEEISEIECDLDEQTVIDCLDTLPRP